MNLSLFRSSFANSRLTVRGVQVVATSGALAAVAAASGCSHSVRDEYLAARGLVVAGAPGDGSRIVTAPTWSPDTATALAASTDALRTDVLER